MITAEKNKWFSSIFYQYQALYLLKKNFHSVLVSGEISSRDELPVMYFANHSSWWDGLVLFQAVEKDRRSHFFMMEEKQLQQYSFFRKLGAFSINRKLNSEIRQTFKYANQMMEKGNAVWIFPQGKIEHQEKRPIVFEPGAAFLANMHQKIRLKPATLHFSFNNQQKPTVSIMFGKDMIYEKGQMTRNELTDFLGIMLETQLNDHRQMAIEDPSFKSAEDFRPIINTGKSTSDHFDSVKRGLQKWTFFSK